MARNPDPIKSHKSRRQKLFKPCPCFPCSLIIFLLQTRARQSIVVGAWNAPEASPASLESGSAMRVCTEAGRCCECAQKQKHEPVKRTSIPQELLQVIHLGGHTAGPPRCTVYHHVVIKGAGVIGQVGTRSAMQDWLSMHSARCWGGMKGKANQNS
jgi:hypothetical protein